MNSRRREMDLGRSELPIRREQQNRWVRGCVAGSGSGSEPPPGPLCGAQQRLPSPVSEATKDRSRCEDLFILLLYFKLFPKLNFFYLDSCRFEF